MKPFNLTDTPLEGSNLIEASAGTGKTFAIEGLFLRLLLEKRIPLEQILVVTFTQAATEELKERIRNKIRLAKDAFSRGTCADALITTLVKKVKPRQLAVGLLQNALAEFDRAAIFTIHGFCQRILLENAFETGCLFDTELLHEQSKLLQEIADDFWRQHIYTAIPEFVSYALREIKGPEYFIRLLGNTIPTEIKIIPEAPSPSMKSLRPYQETLARLKELWPPRRRKVIALLNGPALNSNIYGRIDPPPPKNGRSKREQNVLSMAAEMDRLAKSKPTGFPLFPAFEKFTTTKIVASTRKGQRPPADAFFDLCDELYRTGQVLREEMEATLLYLKAGFFEYAAEELIKRKNTANIQFFDDLLTVLKAALNLPGGSALAETIRKKFKAALIDEFQDTDAVQYGIFSKLFSSSDSILFVIGDPKQAIYGFRGADVFSYINASQKAEKKYTLSQNWRSNPGLIQAVNTIFSRIKSPFVIDEIAYTESSPASGKYDPAQDPSPLQLWFFSTNGDAPLNKSEANKLIANQVTAEIIHLLSEDHQRFEEKDIAILVRTNRQARMMKSCLSQRRVPAVLYQAGNVFETHEAMELERILLCISEPANERALNSALITDTMGAGSELLRSTNKEPAVWDRYHARMRVYFQKWKSRGFIQMFQSFMNQERVKDRLLSLPDGERRLTNLLHLAEILHQQWMDRDPGIPGLIKWLAEQRNTALPGPDTHQLRLESDATAVKIVTVHKSKGLEYPVVFCPFSWEGASFKREVLSFHHPEDKTLTLDLRAGKNSEHYFRAQNELLAESIRLLYVAVTRAKERCYLTWGHFKSAETSALGYLFHQPGPPKGLDWTAAMKQHLSEKKASDLMADLKALESRSGGAIRLRHFSSPVKIDSYAGRKEKDPPLVGREFSRKIDTSWKISSYSSLLSRQAPTGELPDHDAFFQADWHFPGPPSAISDSEGRNREKDIFTFPRGARAGTFFHEIFEQLDFRAASSNTCGRWVEERLKAYGFEPDWRGVVCDMVEQVVNSRLLENNTELTLSSIPPHERMNEMEFYFPVRHFSPQTLKQIFITHAGIDFPHALPEHLEKLTFSPARGYMKGYIDLVFQHGGKFYLVDWKSNHLGSDIEAYERGKLDPIMREAFYYIQYQLYVLALHQYLKHRLPAYCYETDFGGVFYIFCRGVDSAKGAGYGIFHDRPSSDFIEALGRALIPGGTEYEN